MPDFAQHEGTWSGTNGFRLLPDDPIADAPMTARVSTAAKGRLVQIAYSWSHPGDGAQEGLLVLGGAGSPDGAAAFWGDSWHQHPEPRTLDGTVSGATATVGYTYAGDWRWEIAVDVADPDLLTMTMNNVVPASSATDAMASGPYAAMHAVLRRAG